MEMVAYSQIIRRVTGPDWDTTLFEDSDSVGIFYTIEDRLRNTPSDEMGTAPKFRWYRQAVERFTETIEIHRQVDKSGVR